VWGGMGGPWVEAAVQTEHGQWGVYKKNKAKESLRSNGAGPKGADNRTMGCPDDTLASKAKKVEWRKANQTAHGG